MKIFEFKATTFYSGLSVPVSGTYLDERGYSVLSKKAFEIYRQKIKADPRLSEYVLRFIITERETDKDGIFWNGNRIFRDYGFEGGNIDNNIVLIEERHFNK